MSLHKHRLKSDQHLLGLTMRVYT